MLHSYLADLVSTFTGGQIALKIDRWCQITSDNQILRLVSGAHIPFLDAPPTSHTLPRTHFSPQLSVWLDEEISRLLRLHIIKQTTHEAGEFISPIFLTDKKDGGHRLILNLKQFNTYVPYHHFKMHGIPEITRLVSRNCFMAVIDIKDAYYSVPVDIESQKYLKFSWGDHLYQFCVLPNGLSPAPRWFTKLLKPPMATLRELGHVNSPYIDDIYLQGDSFLECKQNVTDTVNLLIDLNLFPHPAKTNVLISQEVDVLGFTINSRDMTIRLTLAKRHDLMPLLRQTLAKPSVKIRDLAMVIGKLVATFPGTTFGPLFYRNLEADKQTALNANGHNFEKFTTLRAASKDELRWWIQSLPSSYRSLVPLTPTLEIFSDASDTGWGVTFGQRVSQGQWTLAEASYHINIKEVMAVYFGLVTMLSSYSDTCIKLHIDNTVAVSVIKHMGTSHNALLNSFTKDIWLWAKQRNNWLVPVYIPSRDNPADLPSRKIYVDAEWQLTPGLFRCACHTLQYQPDVDLFASHLNFQLPRYISYRPDPSAFATDAFSISWSNLNFYAFPPFSCISQCLQKIKVDMATGLIIVPKWPTQPFYPVLLKMLLRPPYLIAKHIHNLVMPNQPGLTSDIAEKTNLLACVVSGKTS